MLSKKQGYSYIVLPDGERFPIKLNKNEVNSHVDKMLQNLESLSKSLMDLYETNTELYYLLRDEIFDRSCIRVDDGKCWNLANLIYDLKEFRKSLESNDDKIPKREDIETLRDIGFVRDYCEKYYYSKILEDTDEKEVVEEVILKYEKPLYRRRTTIWEQVPGGKHSDKITYEDLPINKDLKRIIKNTKAVI